MKSRDYNSLEIYFFDSDLRRAAVHPVRAVQFRPGVDMYETAEALKIKMELPGIAIDHLSITLSADDRVLHVAGERREPATEQQERIRCYHLEIIYGAFAHEINLPSGVRFDRDRVTANYRDGFLMITLPKRGETSTETRTIQITQE
jgi:HSP20 family protein